MPLCTSVSLFLATCSGAVSQQETGSTVLVLVWYFCCCCLIFFLKVFFCLIFVFVLFYLERKCGRIKNMNLGGDGLGEVGGEERYEKSILYEKNKK